jgi:hypothetical protein
MRTVDRIPEWLLGGATAAFTILAIACFEACKVRSATRLNCWLAEQTGLPCESGMLTALTAAAVASCLAALMMSIEVRLR